MRNSTGVCSIAIALVSIFALLSGISHAGIEGTKHDLSSGSGAGFTYATNQKCVFCHTPHGANRNVTSRAMYNSTVASTVNNTPAAGNQPLLLWNRGVANSGGYKMYTSSTMTPGLTGVIGVYSLMCLSCHDGVGAMNSMTTYPSDVSSPPPAPEVGVPGPALGDAPTMLKVNIGDRDTGADDGITHLENDHPISFNYKYAYEQSWDAATSSYALKTFASASNFVRFFPNPNNPTQPGAIEFVECSTCHNPHEYGNPIYGTAPFLVTSTIRSALCRACHNK